MPKIIKIKFGFQNYCENKLVQFFDSQCRKTSLEVAPTILATFWPTLNFRLVVTYLQFPVQVCI